MSQLIYLKDDIDRGMTAKLVISGSKTTVTIRIQKGQHDGIPCYFWQLAVEGFRPYPEIPSTHTELHPSWGNLLDTIDGVQTLSVDWQLCLDPLLDYLPPERMEAP